MSLRSGTKLKTYEDEHRLSLLTSVTDLGHCITSSGRDRLGVGGHMLLPDEGVSTHQLSPVGLLGWPESVA